jgi:hypothetical protein
MGGIDEPLGLEVEKLWMRGELPRPKVDEHAVFGLADLDPPSHELVGNGVAVSVNADEALDIDDAMVKAVELGEPFGPGGEGRLFRGEEFPG